MRQNRSQANNIGQMTKIPPKQLMKQQNFQVRHSRDEENFYFEERNQANEFIGVLAVVVLSIVGIFFGVYLGQVTQTEAQNKEFNRKLVIEMIRNKQKIGVLKKQKQSLMESVLADYRHGLFVKSRNYQQASNFRSQVNKKQSRKMQYPSKLHQKKVQSFNKS